MVDHRRACRACRAELEHCHGTLIQHLLRTAECTEDDCPGPMTVLHEFGISCASVGCRCAEPPATVAVV